MTRILLGGLVAPAAVALVSPTADKIVSIALIAVVGLLILGWLIRQGVGELALHREYRRPSSRPPERESCLRRVYPPVVTDVEHRATAANIAELTARCAQLEAVTRKLAEANDRGEQELAS